MTTPSSAGPEGRHDDQDWSSPLWGRPDTMVAAREGTSPQTTNGPEPIVVNGQICHQCR